MAKPFLEPFFKNISQVVADENGVFFTIFEKIHKKLKNNKKRAN
jgi:hypothetical protein